MKLARHYRASSLLIFTAGLSPVSLTRAYAATTTMTTERYHIIFAATEKKKKKGTDLAKTRGGEETATQRIGKLRRRSIMPSIRLVTLVRAFGEYFFVRVAFHAHSMSNPPLISSSPSRRTDNPEFYGELP